MSFLSGLPVFTCDQENLTRAFRLALGTLAANMQMRQEGVLTEPRPCLMAGLDYPTAWTRDAAINVYFAAALLDPEAARNTLLSVLDPGTDGPVIGGQYWDRIIWALGAERLWRVTGDEDFLRFAWGVIRRSEAELRQGEYDPADGLFRGPAVYGDGVSAYPERYRNPSLASGILLWPEEHPVERVPRGAGIPMKALSTNCVWEHTYRILARMADALGEDPRLWSDRADAMKEAINRAFWNPATGLYDYLAGECDAQESLGLAFAILFDIADEEKTRSIAERAYATAHGIPCVWPAFPPYPPSGYGRHSGTVWPHIQGFWAAAMRKVGRADRFEDELFALAGHAVRDGQFAEIYHPEDGRIYGGLQEAGDGIREWKSCVCQTWSAAAYLNMVMDGLFGLDEAGNPGEVLMPRGVTKMRLEGLKELKH